MVHASLTSTDVAGGDRDVEQRAKLSANLLSGLVLAQSRSSMARPQRVTNALIAL